MRILIAVDGSAEDEAPPTRRSEMSWSLECGRLPTAGHRWLPEHKGEWESRAPVRRRCRGRSTGHEEGTNLLR